MIVELSELDSLLAKVLRDLYDAAAIRDKERALTLSLLASASVAQLLAIAADAHTGPEMVQ